jgi:hypothetical protein
LSSFHSNQTPVTATASLIIQSNLQHVIEQKEVGNGVIPRLEFVLKLLSPRSKLDLLVRVRYRNEVPPPSFPPQLVQIPDDLDRFTRPDWISEYASSIPAPMLVDSEGGMPMDLNRYDGIWTGEMAGKRKRIESSLQAA